MSGGKQDDDDDDDDDDDAILYIKVVGEDCICMGVSFTVSTILPHIMFLHIMYVYVRARTYQIIHALYILYTYTYSSYTCTFFTF